MSRIHPGWDRPPANSKKPPRSNRSQQSVQQHRRARQRRRRWWIRIKRLPLPIPRQQTQTHYQQPYRRSPLPANPNGKPVPTMLYCQSIPLRHFGRIGIHKRITRPLPLTGPRQRSLHPSKRLLLRLHVLHSSINASQTLQDTTTCLHLRRPIQRLPRRMTVVAKSSLIRGDVSINSISRIIVQGMGHHRTKTMVTMVRRRAVLP